MNCPKCKSKNVDVNGIFYHCLECGQIDDSTFSMIMEGCIKKEGGKE
jgi:hypothetical protein